MALTLNGVATLLPQAVSGPIFAKAAESSLVMQLAQRVPTTLTGTAIPVTVGTIEADWVAEGAAKYVANPSATTLTMTPVKVACIVPV
ncbi:MAG: phage major capsid protein, partial [Candidatus Nanopelagicales bacterium]